jgi:hypothetical protein
LAVEKIQVPKPYQRSLKFNVKKKIKTLTNIELPLLTKSGFDINLVGIEGVTTNCNDVTSGCNICSGPGRIRTNDPRHVKAVS